MRCKERPNPHILCSPEFAGRLLDLVGGHVGVDPGQPHVEEALPRPPGGVQIALTRARQCSPEK